MTDSGYTGYGYLSGAGFTSLFIKPNGTDAQLVKAAAAFYEIGQLPEAAFAMLNFTFPRWIDYCNMFLQGLPCRFIRPASITESTMPSGLSR